MYAYYYINFGLFNKHIKMAHLFQITIAESIHELRSHQRKNGELIGNRLLMLIEIKSK